MAHFDQREEAFSEIQIRNEKTRAGHGDPYLSSQILGR
jgi:hypothetical protein